jgi:hypothetical protein
VRELARGETIKAVEALARVPASPASELLACVATDLAARLG